MRPIITPEEAQRLDAAAPDPVSVLMERAGLAVALAAVRMGVGYGSRVIVLTGTGNNGGDGYVAARHLARRGADVALRATGYPKGDGSVARAAAVAAVHAGVPISRIGDPEPADLVIDALYGSGFRGTLPERAAAWAHSDGRVLAVDVPSGVSAATGEATGPAFTAERTVTFHALKMGHVFNAGPDHCGMVDVADIGLGGEVAEFALCEDADASLPARPRQAHKWSAGSVVVVGGSPGLTGAASLAAGGALEFGAGAAAIACAGRLHDVYAAADPGVMTIPIGTSSTLAPHDVPDLLDAAERYDVMVVGPGLGAAGGAVAAALAAGWAGPLVIDADGLTADVVEAVAGRLGPTVLTPHAGELLRLTGGESGWKAAAGLAERTGSTLVLKGNPTVVLGGERWVVTSGGPELATIGTGDVLAGMIAAAIARGLPAEAAARTAAHRHGRAGAALAERTTVTAPRLMREIGRFAR